MLLKTKFPDGTDGNVNVLTVTRVLNKEVPNDSSGPNLSQRPKNRSSSYIINLMKMKMINYVILQRNM
ncbi:hypothetical protein CXB51_026329 [Gossypium anomalum]|uniref:Uncharacterized protein n=1 Tax=Gossypium anomalum TaxID=47600 RepID=A0A8J5YS75_9ROSI|nr:hypothetical protein CXB51_026329 [Gossypium anomalum]